MQISYFTNTKLDAIKIKIKILSYFRLIIILPTHNHASKFFVNFRVLTIFQFLKQGHKNIVKNYGANYYKKTAGRAVNTRR